MRHLSEQELKEIVAKYVDGEKIATTSLTITRDNALGLVDTIGKIFMIDGDFVDDMPELDGEFLSYGKTIEEYFIDLIPPMDKPDLDSEKYAEALKYYAPANMPTSYSTTLKPKVLPTSVPFNDINRAVHNEEQLVKAVTKITKKLSDSETSMIWNMKFQLLGEACKKCIEAMSTTTTFAVATPYALGTYLKDSDSDARGIIVKDYKANNATSWADAIKKGFIQQLDLVTTIAKPVDTETGEAFIIQLKKDVKKAKRISSGYSLNGNNIGATSTMKLYILEDLTAYLDVKVEAGAFHQDKVLAPVGVKEVRDFGDADAKIFAILVDTRGVKLHRTYIATYDNTNGLLGFINYFRHCEYTAFLSRNTFMKVYKEA